MADQRSKEMLAFNFASRTFAYRRLTQGLSRALSAFSSFMSENPNKVVKVNQCAQSVNDIGIATNDADNPRANLRATFKCFREAGLKLTRHECHFAILEQSKLISFEEPSHHYALNPISKMFRNFSKRNNFCSQKDFTVLFGISELIPQLCPETIRTHCSILQDA